MRSDINIQSDISGSSLTRREERGTESSWEKFPWLTFPSVLTAWLFPPSDPLAVTSHSATRRPGDASRKSPLTGNDPWATAAQPPPLDAANWTAARRHCGRGSPEGGRGRDHQSEDNRTRLDGGREKRRRMKCDTKTCRDKEMDTCVGCRLFLCLHEPSSHLTTARGGRGKFSWGALSSYCHTTGIYLILFLKSIWRIVHITGFMFVVIYTCWDKERWMSGSRDTGDEGSREERRAAISSSFLFLSCTSPPL